MKKLLSPWFALLTMLLLVALRVMDPTFIESVRLRYFDTLITSNPVTENNIYTVNIDEASLEKYGQWPFKRDQYANIIAELYSHNAGLVVFNVMMPEADRLGGDKALAETIKDYPVILANTVAPKSKNTPRQPSSALIGSENIGVLYQVPGIISNIPVLEHSAAGVGLTNTLPEIDGVNRRLPIFAAYQDRLYPSMPLEVLRVISGDSTFQVKLNNYGVEKARVPSFSTISTDTLGRIWIDSQQGYKQVSLLDLPKDFNKAIVFVGPTAAGLSNPIPTAKGAVFPHHMQASVVGTLVNGVNISRPDWADGAEMAAVILLSVLIIFLTRWKYGIIPIIGIIFGLYSVGGAIFDRNGILIDVVFPIIALGMVYAHAYSVKFVTELNAKLLIKKQFGTYLSRALVEKLQKNPELLRLGGETRDLSIMFTDVRGFTTISEHYGVDVQGLTQIMNRYMTAMTAKIIDNDGTLDKYIGDAQMAFWNAPLDDKDHALNAVKTGLQMLGDLDEFNNEITKEGIPAFGMGLGINTGSVVVGNMGSRQRFDYTCLGDSVNLASRLEGQSKNYGVRIVLGERTAELVKDHYSVVEMDTIAVKGKTVGVKVFTIGNTIGHIHNEFLKEYYRGNWDKAIAWAKRVVNNDEVTIKDYYKQMIERMEEGLPPNWDGVYRATSK